MAHPLHTALKECLFLLWASLMSCWQQCPKMMLQVAYCEEHVECRRVMLLSHFGEADFSAAKCAGTCDTCKGNAGKSFELRDLTQDALNAIHVRT